VPLGRPRVAAAEGSALRPGAPIAPSRASDVGNRSGFLWTSYSQGAKDAAARLLLEIVGCPSAYCIDHSTIREKR
jgi:hypothetical protein